MSTRQTAGSPTSSTGPEAGDGRSDRLAPRVWAPSAERLTLHIGRHGSGGSGAEGGTGSGRDVPMTREGGGWWAAPEALPAGTRYGFAVDDGPVVPDPRARRLPDGPHGLAEVVDFADVAWSDGDWEGVELAGTTIYELHVGTFTPEGTLDAAAGRLDELVELGIDIVELMPVNSFPGRWGWGYDGVGLWSVHEPYGGPAALAAFVDAAHARGLAVFLDVVHNHLGPDGNYLGMFGPYFTDRHETPWGEALNLDGPDSDSVRDFVIGNALSWLRDYHLDGLRLDAVHELHDERALPILEELAAAVDDLEEETGRTMVLVAESDRNDMRTVTSRDDGGLGIDAQWADDVHHAFHVALTGETQGYYADFEPAEVLRRLLTTPFLHAGTYSTFRRRGHGRPVDPARVDGSQFVVSLQTHDQVGNRRDGDRLAASVDPRLLRCGVALLLTSPYTPMLFMGEEWSASTPWQFFTDHDDELGALVREGRRAEFATHGWTPESVPDPQDHATREASVLRWDERGSGEHQLMLDWYRALLTLRRARPDLRDPDLAEVHVEPGPHERAFVVVRGRHRVAVNLGDEPVELETGLDEGPHGVVLLALDPTVATVGGRVTLPPRSVAVIGPATPA